MDKKDEGVGLPAGLMEDRDMREQVAGPAVVPAGPQTESPLASDKLATGGVTIPEGGFPASWPGEPQTGD